MPDRLAHPAHLPVATLVDRDLESVGREPAHSRRSREAILELHAPPQRPQRDFPDRWVGHLGDDMS